MATTYAYAPEVAEIGRRLIAQYHADLLDFGTPRIEWLFRNEAAKKNGKMVWGSASKVGGRNAFLAMPRHEAAEGNPEDVDVEPFFVIEIAFDIWLQLSSKQRVALVDHEICHLSVKADDRTGDPKLGIVGHDLEEFESILVRHGLFRPDLKNFAVVAAKQLSLLGDPVTGEVNSVLADDTTATVVSVDMLGTISNLADRMAR
ncbi:MAG: hypothetical protein M3N98_16285 [Actinomycetota bacterium]|nr:hypothetical protein [Actinomycetota bacterium]